MTDFYYDDSNNRSTQFNQPLNLWDTSNVTNMAGMFYGAPNFNQDITSWDVSNVTNFQKMFGGIAFLQSPITQAFDGDISGWTVSSGTNFQGILGMLQALIAIYQVGI